MNLNNQNRRATKPALPELENASRRNHWGAIPICTLAIGCILRPPVRPLLGLTVLLTCDKEHQPSRSRIPPNMAASSGAAKAALR